ncbi:MAG: hypothetical protein H7833_08190 [Magnetococcus sp. DMHC-1]
MIDRNGILHRSRVSSARQEPVSPNDLDTQAGYRSDQDKPNGSDPLVVLILQ